MFQENLAGRTDFLKTGGGTLTLSDPANYSGASRILTGTLKLSPATNILPPATLLSLEDSSSVLDLNGATQTVASLASVSGSVVQLNGGTLIISGNTGDAVVAGSITGNGNLSNTGTLRLVGNATLDVHRHFHQHRRPRHHDLARHAACRIRQQRHRARPQRGENRLLTPSPAMTSP